MLGKWKCLDSLLHWQLGPTSARSSNMLSAASPSSSSRPASMISSQSVGAMVTAGKGYCWNDKVK